MKSRFFLSGIVPDLARIAHTFTACFLDPLGRNFLGDT